MRGVQPSRLTDKELVCYIDLQLHSDLNVEWAKELLRRFILASENDFVLRANKTARAEGYRHGFDDGHAAGYEDGVKSMPPV
jgi:hypothetical protein